jgi:hypothetical protein
VVSCPPEQPNDVSSLFGKTAVVASKKFQPVALRQWRVKVSGRKSGAEEIGLESE